MKILIIECNAEELSANRTVMDNINKVLNNFTDAFFGVNDIDFSKAMCEAEQKEEEDE